MEVFRPADSPEGVWEEVEIVSREKSPEQILFYLPFKGSNSRRIELYESVRVPLEKHLMRRFPDAEKIGQARFIGFRPDGTAYLMEKNRFSFFGIVNWSAQALRPIFVNVDAPPPKVTIDHFRIIELVFGLIAAWPFLLIAYGIILIIAH